MQPPMATRTCTGPAVPTGVTAVIWVGLSTVNDMASVPLNVTSVAPVNPAPVIVTDVPPVTGPVPGLTVVTTGCPARLTSAGDAVVAPGPAPGPAPGAAAAVKPASSSPASMRLGSG